MVGYHIGDRRYGGMNVILVALLASASPVLSQGVPSANRHLDGCEQAVPLGGTRAIRVGSLWTGVGTPVGSAATKDGRVLVSYYDADRWMEVAAVDADRKRVCTLRLPSRFAGWDAHNGIAMAIAPDRTLHLVGNMHASAMVYMRGTAADISSMRPDQMIGRDENQATYPKFLHDSAGNLLFLYRTGSSGNGTWLLNRWIDGHWQRIGALFVDHDRQGHVSAYPSSFAIGPDGTYHVAVVWRRTPDVATNFAVTYASTRDFINWRGAGGRSIKGPLGPDQMAVVEQTGPNAGLVNSASVIVAPDGVPVILYPRHAHSGNDTIVAARAGPGGWHVRELAVSETATSVAGGGALAALPSFGVLAQIGWTATVRLSFPPHDHPVVALNLKTLAAPPGQTPSANAPVAMYTPAQVRGMAKVSTRQSPVLDNGVDGPQRATLRWFAQVANGDKPRACTEDAPKACAPPPAPLILDY